MAVIVHKVVHERTTDVCKSSDEVLCKNQVVTEQVLNHSASFEGISSVFNNDQVGTGNHEENQEESYQPDLSNGVYYGKDICFTLSITEKYLSSTSRIFPINKLKCISLSVQKYRGCAI